MVDNEKGDKFLTEVGDQAAELVAYYKRFPGNKFDAVRNDARYNLSIISDVVNTGKYFKREELGKKYELRYNQLASGL